MYLDKTGTRQVATCPFVYKDLTSKCVALKACIISAPSVSPSDSFHPFCPL